MDLDEPSGLLKWSILDLVLPVCTPAYQRRRLTCLEEAASLHFARWLVFMLPHSLDNKKCTGTKD